MLEQQKLKSLAKKLLSQINFKKFDSNFVDKSYSQCIQKIATKVNIKNNQPHFTEPTQYHGRYGELKYLISAVCSKYAVPDCKFIVILNDAYSSQFPCFSTIRVQKKDIFNIPIPMGNVRGLKEGHGTPIKNWDKYVKIHMKHKYPWEEKINQAIFRGQLSWQTWANNGYGIKKTVKWSEITRGRLYEVCKDNNLFDIGFTKLSGIKTGAAPEVAKPIPFVEQQKYKYIISVGTNADWAERLRTHLFANSVTIKHEAESCEWFYYLLEPWEHYIPCKINFSDLIKNIEWASQNQDECQTIVSNANLFAETYMKEKVMIEFMYYVIREYSKLN
jgi:hypothetical protein